MACASITAGADPIAIRRGIQRAAEAAIEAVKANAVAIETHEQTANVATISSGDELIGEKIAECIDEVGKDGVIIAEKSQTFGIQVDVKKGLMFERGFLSPYMASDMGNMKGELDEAYVLITDQKILNIQDILPVLEAVKQAVHPLLIIAEDLGNEVVNTLLLNRMHKTLDVVAVKAPGFMDSDSRKKQLMDIAVLTGGQVISPEFGLTPADATKAMLGRAKKVKITKDSTLIVGGFGNKEAIEERCKQIKAELERTTASGERRELRERSLPRCLAASVFCALVPQPRLSSSPFVVVSRTPSALFSPPCARALSQVAVWLFSRPFLRLTLSRRKATRGPVSKSFVRLLRLPYAPLPKMPATKATWWSRSARPSTRDVA